MTTGTPAEGTIYLATDNRWYRWPDPTAYPTREAAEAAAWSASLTPPVSAPPASTSPGSAPWGGTPMGGAPRSDEWLNAFQSAATPAESTGAGRATVYVGAVLIGLPLVVGLIAMAVLPDHHTDGGCEGIGFGCTPAPSSAAFFATFLALVIAVPATGLAWLLMALGDRQSTSFRGWPPILKAGSVLAGYAAVALLVLISRSA